MAVTTGRLTLDEFLMLPEAEPALEFLDGMVMQKVSPKGHHSALQFELARVIDLFARPSKLARVFTELRATFGGASPVPDVVVYRWERIPTDARGRLAHDFRQPPDIAIEIVSPKQSVNALFRRCQWYVAHRVQVALLVDPADESILCFQPNQMPRILRGTDLIDFGDVLPSFELTVQQLFACLEME